MNVIYMMPFFHNKTVKALSNKTKGYLGQWSPIFLSPRTGLRLIILPRPTKREGETQIVFNLLVFEHAFKIKLFEL